REILPLLEGPSAFGSLHRPLPILQSRRRACPRGGYSELDEDGRSHYERRDFLREAHIAPYDKTLFYNATADKLTPLAYKGDRTMRESGFDPTSRFGPLNLDVVHYAPVCLNVLLYQMEKDLATLHGL